VADQWLAEYNRDGPHFSNNQFVLFFSVTDLSKLKYQTTDKIL